ncbi:hypothetical protein GCM10023196_026100 [Actinoallomurus vinaceus]|uniref:Uncharacterized protein n=1 Tax=Actinoallomurus vinaceus TaxID=1080074 RepID=A0ABP8U819_9ACTN
MAVTDSPGAALPADNDNRIDSDGDAPPEGREGCGPAVTVPFDGVDGEVAGGVAGGVFVGGVAGGVSAGGVGGRLGSGVGSESVAGAASAAAPAGGSAAAPTEKIAAAPKPTQIGFALEPNSTPKPPSSDRGPDQNRAGCASDATT